MRGSFLPVEPEFDVQAAIERAAKVPEGTPARILERAEELFAERGFEGVTTRDVATAAGVNVSTLHFHWKNKATLFEAVNQNLDRHVLAFFAKVGAEREADEPSVEELIDRWVDWSLQLLTDHPAISRLTLQYMAGSSPPASTDSLRYDVNIFHFIEGEIRKRIDPDVAERLDPGLFMMTLFYAGVVAYSDSPLQQAMLGGSIFEDPAVLERFRRFARHWIRTMLEVD